MTDIKIYKDFKKCRKNIYIYFKVQKINFVIIEIGLACDIQN